MNTYSDRSDPIDLRVAEVFRAVREVFQRAGYQPADAEVGRILRSMLAAHEAIARGERRFVSE